MNEELLGISVAQRVIHQSAVLRLLGAVVNYACSVDIRVSVAVVDTAGLLAGFVRMNSAFLVSERLARTKARCATGLGMAPDAAEKILASEAPRVRNALMMQPDFVLIRGGMPILDMEILIGGIGVSGASEAQDVACALVGLKVLGAEDSQR